MNRSGLPGAVICLMAAVPTAPAEWPLSGETVRVTTFTGPTSVKGVLLQTEAAVLTVSLGAGKPPVRIPLASIERLEVVRGRRATVKEGAIVGGLAGAALGVAAMASLGYALCEGASSCGTSTEGYLVGVGIFGTAGAGVGATATFLE